MTINEYAKSKHYTRQAVYQRYTKHGYKTQDLTDSKGRLTNRGLDILESLYAEISDKPKEVSIHELTEQLRQKQAEIDEAKKETEQARSDRDIWHEQAVHETERVRILEEKVDKLTEAVLQLNKDIHEARLLATIEPAKLTTGEKQHGKVYNFFHPGQAKQKEGKSE